MSRYISKHTGKKIDDTIDNVSNPNLLDNWYFGNPVDQRGGYVVPPGRTYYDLATNNAVGTLTTYVKVDSIFNIHYVKITIDGKQYWCLRSDSVRGYTGAGYGLDRFDLFGGVNPTMLIEDGHIRLTGSGFFRQIIPVSQIPRGTVVTMSILMASGDLYALTATVPDNQVDSPQVNFPGGFLRIYGWNADTDVYFIFFEAEVSPVAMKLELGPTQTLAHQENGVWQLNEIPDYGEQLARCQRYAVDITPPSVFNTAYLGTIDGGGAVFMIPLPVTMRESSNSAISCNPSDIQVAIPSLGYYYTPTSVDILQITPTAAFIRCIFSHSMTEGTLCDFRKASDSAKFLITRDL